MSRALSNQRGPTSYDFVLRSIWCARRGISQSQYYYPKCDGLQGFHYANKIPYALPFGFQQNVYGWLNAGRVKTKMILCNPPFFYTCVCVCVWRATLNILQSWQIHGFEYMSLSRCVKTTVWCVSGTSRRSACVYAYWIELDATMAYSIGIECKAHAHGTSEQWISNSTKSVFIKCIIIAMTRLVVLFWCSYFRNIVHTYYM